MIKHILNILYTIKKELKAIFFNQFFKAEDFFVEINYDDYWRKRSGHQLGKLSEWQYERVKLILPFIDSKASSLVDIGCGDGAVLKYIKEKRNLGDRILGADSSSLALEYATKLGVEALKYDIESDVDLKKMPDADYYIFFEILEHLRSSERVLLSAIKKSKKGVFFSVPNTGFFVYRLRLLLGKFPVQWVRTPNEHLRFWTASDMKWWLRNLQIKKYKILFYRGVPILNKLAPSLFAAGMVVAIKHGEPN